MYPYYKYRNVLDGDGILLQYETKCTAIGNDSSFFGKRLLVFGPIPPHTEAFRPESF